MRNVMLALTMVAVLVSTAAVGAAQDQGAAQGRGAVERERAGYERAVLLRQQIQVGWTREQVAQIMGQPEQAGQVIEGGDVVERWWYHGFSVGVEFRHGYVSHWFFRFMK